MYLPFFEFNELDQRTDFTGFFFLLSLGYHKECVRKFFFFLCFLRPKYGYLCLSFRSEHASDHWLYALWKKRRKLLFKGWGDWVTWRAPKCAVDVAEHDLCGFCRSNVRGGREVRIGKDVADRSFFSIQSYVIVLLGQSFLPSFLPALYCLYWSLTVSLWR